MNDNATICADNAILDKILKHLGIKLCIKDKGYILTKNMCYVDMHLKPGYTHGLFAHRADILDAVLHCDFFFFTLIDMRIPNNYKMPAQMGTPARVVANPFFGMTKEEAAIKIDLEQGSIWQKTAMQ